MRSIYLVRHGETDFNRELRFQGQVDVPLNDQGLEQAQRLLRYFESRTVGHVVASDLRRALQTAAPLTEAASLTLEMHAGLREQNFGEVDGWRASDIQARYPDEWARWLQFDADYALPGAETTRQFHARVLAAMEDIALRCRDQDVVVVTHGGVLDMVYRSAREQSLSGPRECEIPNAAVSEVAFDQGRWHILAWAEVAHLDGLPEQPVYRQR